MTRAASRDLQADNIALLARSLANNHLRAGLDTFKTEHGILTEASLVRSFNRRIVVIVGAGMSKEARLPLASEAIPQLIDKVGLDREIVSAELAKLSTAYRLNANDFETNLRALSSTAYGAAKTRKVLQEIYNHKYRPLLSCEIVAHLMKHKFVDAVINFNFDEILDQAINDELNASEFQYIVSDGDCDPLSVEANIPITRPLYIKPHGTVSHPSTLRFTREDYFDVPEPIIDIIRRLLTQKGLDLLVIGFSMQSPELLEILADCSRRPRVFWIGRTKWSPSPDVRRSIRPNIHFLDVGRHQGSVSSLLKAVWKKVDGEFEPRYKPRHLSRHVIISDIFARVPETINPVIYLWDRTIVELCLAIARGRGFVSLRSLAIQRVGAYYSAYRNAEDSIDKRVKKQDSITLLQICERLGLKDLSYSAENLTFKTVSRHRVIVDSKNCDKFIASLLDLVADHADASSVVAKYLEKSRRHRPQLEAGLRENFKGGESEIRLDAVNPGVYRNARQLRSRTALIFETFKLLRRRNWRQLLVISEGGEWLLEKEISQEFNEVLNRNIKLIIADDTHRDDLYARYSKSITIYDMPWWLHNRHMTLTCASSNGDIKGIDLSRRLRTPDLRPLVVSGSDAELARNVFVAYWIRAREKAMRWIDPEEIESFDEF